MPKHETELRYFCRRCNCEIVPTVNDSLFRDGECNACEYARYRSQHKLLDACHHAYVALCDLSYHRCFRKDHDKFSDATVAIAALARILHDVDDDL